MDARTPKRKDWELTPEAFAKLLATLDQDPERASEQYIRLHHKLCKFFEWKNIFPSENEADETINRVCRKLAEEEAVGDVSNYCIGVARLRCLEIYRSPASKTTGLEEVRELAAPTWQDDEDAEVRSRCYARCLSQLPTTEREIILDYYQAEKSAKIDHRKQLAERLGIQLNALRSRTRRIREKIEDCVNQCLR